MSDIIAVKINVSKVDKARLFQGKSGKYLDVLLLPNRSGVDQYGNDYMVVQSVGKEERAAGVRGAILGNGRTLTPTARAASPAAVDAATTPTPASALVVESGAGDELPF